ncbi:MAG: hypothetical protein ACKVW3_02195 [Phycisphaerales bacterium]
MTRVVRQPPLRRWLLPGSVAILVVLAMSPTRWLGSIGGLADSLGLVVAPVKQPVARVVRWLRPPESARDDELVRRLQDDRDRFEALWLEERAENGRLRDQIRVLQQGVPYEGVVVRQVMASVIGPTADSGGGIIEVRAGRSAGIEPGAVATTTGAQFVGLVGKVGPRTSMILLITSKQSDRRSTQGGDRAGDKPDERGLRGRVMLEDSKPGSLCLLYAQGRGVLRGQVEHGGPEPKVGQVVRVEDDQLPAAARLLVIGTIKAADRVAGRYVITVAPTVELDRLSEVILRQAGDETPASTDGGKP